MELNFDKEMDALLRQAARHETPRPIAEAHLDVDELAAFSASALPVKARARAMEHLVDCGNCRTILSNLVFFERQDEEKPAGAFAAAPAVKGSSLADRILSVFKFPALAYGMAGLAMLFAAAIGLMLFRGNMGGADVAQLSKQEAPGAARDAAAQYPYVNDVASTANTNSAVANAAPIASAANNAVGGVFSIPPQSVPGGYSSNSSSNMAPAARKDDAGPALLDAQPKVRSAPVTIDGVITTEQPAPPPPASVDRVNREEDNLRLAKPQQNITDQVTRGQDNFRNSTNNVQIMTPDGSDKDRRLRAITGEAAAGAPREAARDDKEKQTSADETKNAPAKTETKKAGKRSKKNAAAAAEAAASPAPSPAKTPEPKKPDEEERPPC